jgi:hypothetical protein
VIEPTGLVVVVVVSIVAEAVSANDKKGRAVEPAGPDTSEAVTDAESTATVPKNARVTEAEVAVAVSAVV